VIRHVAGRRRTAAPGEEAPGTAVPGLSRPKARMVMPQTIRLSFVVAVTVAAIAVAPATATQTQPAAVECGALSVGPGGDEHGATAGARCLLHAYQQHCRSAVYVLSMFGVDTVASDRFRLVRVSGHCLVDVTISFRIVPQRARTHNGICRTLALKSTHVVAGRCTGTNIPSSLALDPRPQTP